MINSSKALVRIRKKILGSLPLFHREKVKPFGPAKSAKVGNGFRYKKKEFIHFSSLTASETAFKRLTTLQILTIILLTSLVVAGLIINWHAALIVIVAILTTLYFTDLLFNLYLIWESFAKKIEITISDREIKKFDEAHAPKYTILCPLYKEWQVIPQFVTAISKLDYPKDKLQVLLLLEEDDTESIEHIKQFSLPTYFKTVIVPHTLPKTKPKACNYGLKIATGEYVVIFDAEDVPDRDQLKKAVIAFKKEDKSVVCVQAKLNFYNPHYNLLTRAFTAEYSLWFGLILTGLQSIKAPIPLGGTSNHFRKRDLMQMKGWDSFNVTEDCDLGMRIAKMGKRTVLIDSETLEEASSELKNWYLQRSRWIKGYMQSYLVHMRSPKAFMQKGRKMDLITFQLVVGGKVFSMLVNPFMWLITFLYFADRMHFGLFIESLFPRPVLYMGVLSLFLGNFLYVYYYVLGCIKRDHHELVKYIFLIPFYWLFMSAAAWMALYKLITAPHHWFKTKHGAHLIDEKSRSSASAIVGSSLVDKKLAVQTY